MIPFPAPRDYSGQLWFHTTNPLDVAIEHTMVSKIEPVDITEPATAEHLLAHLTRVLYERCDQCLEHGYTPSDAVWAIKLVRELCVQRGWGL